MYNLLNRFYNDHYRIVPRVKCPSHCFSCVVRPIYLAVIKVLGFLLNSSWIMVCSIGWLRMFCKTNLSENRGDQWILNIKFSNMRKYVYIMLCITYLRPIIFPDTFERVCSAWYHSQIAWSINISTCFKKKPSREHEYIAPSK